ncbi:MAG: transketolase [Alphaproteobacteria bacterium]|nr:transketolase [Alphaproteobacteria bacterium]
MVYNAMDLKNMAGAVRADALRAILSAGSGHVGIALGAADIITAVFAGFMRPGIDRFVLSAGHGSAMLYATLKLAGYNIGALSSFRKIGGLPGHPEYGIDGIDATTGPLGQGIGNAVGLALAEKIKNTDARVYCICGDGDLSEGVSSEAIALAGRYKVNNLVLLWDDNGITIDGVALTDMDIPTRMRAAGWNVVSVDGMNGEKISAAISESRRLARPTFIQCKTRIGEYSSVAGTPAAHGLALSANELERLIQKLDSASGRALWAGVANRPHGKHTKITPPDLSRVKTPNAPADMSTRELSGMYINALLSAGVNIVGGSADLGHSTNVDVEKSVHIAPGNFNGNYIDYGVREHAMGAIMNGLAAAGVRPFGSTFLVFSDYMRPAIRIAAMSGLPVIYVFTHDSIAVGADGPTHQPVEQLASLRMIPNINVFRPFNMAEVAYSWRAALGDVSRPSCIILSRQKFKQVPTPAGAEISRGAYIIRPAKSARVRITLLATGAEVALALKVADLLGDSVQVVSVPSVDHFRGQSNTYKKQMLRGHVVAIEASSTTPWFEFADGVIGLTRFGMSGPGGAVYSAMGFDAGQIAREIIAMVKK